MESFGFLFIDPSSSESAPAIGCVYVKSRGGRAPWHPTGYVVTDSCATWQEFERELNRLRCELDDIRREAELRFADASAKKVTLKRISIVRGRH